MNAEQIMFVRDDGGRAAAGFRGLAGDCAARAIAIASGLPYREVYAIIETQAKSERLRRGRRSSAREGVTKRTFLAVMRSLGAKWTPTMGIGTGCRVHLRAAELPLGRLVAVVSGHYVAMVDGVIHDTYDPSREGARCVYGYFTFAH